MSDRVDGNFVRLLNENSGSAKNLCQIIRNNSGSKKSRAILQLAILVCKKVGYKKSAKVFNLSRQHATDEFLLLKRINSMQKMFKKSCNTK